MNEQEKDTRKFYKRLAVSVCITVLILGMSIGYLIGFVFNTDEASATTGYSAHALLDDGKFSSPFINSNLNIEKNNQIGKITDNALLNEISELNSELDVKNAEIENLYQQLQQALTESDFDAGTIEVDDFNNDGTVYEDTNINRDETYPENNLVNYTVVESTELNETIDDSSNESDISTNVDNTSDMNARTIKITGNTIGYIDAYFAYSAPDGCAGIYNGADDTQDGSFCYFVGHNPGVFNYVTTLGLDDVVYVCDRNGHERGYSVVDRFLIPTTTSWQDIEEYVTAFGESVIFQTCLNNQYLIVIAKG